MNHAAEAAISAGILVAALMTKDEHIIQAYCGITGLLAGYLGSMVFPIKGMQLHVRWITSVICALIAGPILTTYATKYLPSFPIIQVAMAVSGFCAVFGVIILKLVKPMFLPVIMALLPEYIAKAIKKYGEKDN